MISQEKIKKILEEYSFLGIDLASLNQIIEELKNELSSNNEKETSTLLNRIYNTLDKTTKNRLVVQETKYEILNNFINKKLSKIQNPEESLNEFRDFMIKYDYLLDIETIKKLIEENDTLVKILEATLETVLYSGKNRDKNIARLFVIYCHIKKIPLDKKRGGNEKVECGYAAYKETMRTCAKLNDEEQMEYIEKAKKGDKEARNKIVENNFGLVVDTAKKFNKGVISMEDLVAAGILGLIKAIDTFNPQRDCKLSTYAVTLINHEIENELRSNGLFNFTSAKSDIQKRYNDACKALKEELGRPPSLDEIRIRLGIPYKEAYAIAHSFQDGAVSLDEGIQCDNKESGNPLKYSIPDLGEGVEEIIETQEIAARIKTILYGIDFTENEKIVLILLYGFNGNEPHTQRQIAAKLGVKYQRIGQISQSIILKIIKSKYAQELASLTNDIDASMRALIEMREAIYKNPKIGIKKLEKIRDDAKKEYFN